MVMVSMTGWYRRPPIFLLCCLIMLLASRVTVAAQENDKTPGSQYRTTQLQLQSQLMSYADELAAILGQATTDVFEQNPKIEVRYLVRRDFILSVAAAFTIAAGPNPEVALLDMVVIVTLGRMIYEEHWQKQLGKLVEPIFRAYKQLEADIWSIAAGVLTPREQQDLRGLIRTWRRNRPGQLLFTHIRFSDFAAERHGASEAEAAKPRGLFKSVQQATQSVDKILLLAERGLYLGARIPLLANGIAQMGVLSLLMTPEVEQLRTDTSKLSDGIHRLANMTEKLPADLLQDLLSGEKQLRGLLADLNQTLTAGNTLMASANTTLGSTSKLVAQLGLDQAAANGRRLDIAALTSAVEQLNSLVGSLGQFLESPGWEQRLPQLLQVMDRAEQEGEDFVDYAFLRALVLLLLLLIGGVLAALLYQYVSRQLWGSRK
jgi:hypothetical protein